MDKKVYRIAQKCKIENRKSVTKNVHVTKTKQNVMKCNEMSRFKNTWAVEKNVYKTA